MPKKLPEDKLAKKMEELACALADKLTNDTEPTKAATDAFGKLTSYFAMTRKLNLKNPEPDDEEGTFNDFRNKLTQVEHGVKTHQ